jgi:hypothetical protein
VREKDMNKNTGMEEVEGKSFGHCCGGGRKIGRLKKKVFVERKK